MPEPATQLHLTKHQAPLDSDTHLQAAGADNVLIISTTVPGLTFRSIYVGAGTDASTHITHLALRRTGPPALLHRQAAGGQLPVTHARQLCLTDHAAALRDELGAGTTVQIPDTAAAACARTY